MNRGLRYLALWSAGLLAGAVCTSGLLTASVMLLSPRGLLFGKSAIQFAPTSFLAAWMAGTMLAYRKSRSLQLALQLAAAGALLSVILPLLFIFVVLVIYGLPGLGR